MEKITTESGFSRAEFGFRRGRLASRFSFLLATGTCALVLCASTGARAALFVPSGLAPGDIYQLAFVTSGTTSATSADIGDYNSFVQAAANAAGMGSVVWTPSPRLRPPMPMATRSSAPLCTT
jgi:hypothetical protein